MIYFIGLFVFILILFVFAFPIIAGYAISNWYDGASESSSSLRNASFDDEVGSYIPNTSDVLRGAARFLECYEGFDLSACDAIRLHLGVIGLNGQIYSDVHESALYYLNYARPESIPLRDKRAHWWALDNEGKEERIEALLLAADFAESDYN